ncbi:MAG: ThiF family adenylyltransferase [Thermoproteales archaeon]|nr:ThiF family adenylyltransferase [Thermoproteales archaeon]
MNSFGNSFWERYSRQLVLPVIGKEGQLKLKESSVAVIGCGALGTTSSMLLARAGVGRIKVIDRDYLELHNLQRQILYDEEDILRAEPKAVICARKLKAINSSIEVEAVVDDVSSENVEDLIRDVDLVVDGLDNLETRFIVNDAALKLSKPWIYGSVISTYGVSMNIIPGETPCLRDLIPHLPPPGSLPTCETAGVLNAAAIMVASIQVTEAIKILTGQEYFKDELLFMDPWNREFKRIKVRRSPSCPSCVKKRYEFLERRGTRSIVLCGRNAVQVMPPRKASLNLGKLAEKLSKIGVVKYSSHMLLFKTGSYEIALFPDGRAIIKGTSDGKVARAIYSKYIGV